MFAEIEVKAQDLVQLYMSVLPHEMQKANNHTDEDTSEDKDEDTMIITKRIS